MNRRFLWVAVALMTAVGMTGCSSSDDEADASPKDSGQTEFEQVAYIDLTRDELKLVENNNEFAFNLFRQLTAEQGQIKSEIISPISITYALGMLNNGASGETRAQINEVLGFGDTGADGINEFCRKMLSDAPRLDPSTKVMIANTIFLNENYQLKPFFVEAAKKYYGAEPETRNFNDGKTLDVINKWASDHTEQMIEKVLDEGEFKPSSISYLLNAIYFKGAWSNAFKEAETKDEPFTCYGANVTMYNYTDSGCYEVNYVEPGETVTRQMMHQTDKFGYTENDICQAVSLPYGNGSYRMTVLLPREGKSVWDVAETLNSETWRQYRYMGETAIVDLKLPRFEVTSNIELKSIMSALGMPDAFNPMKAEFPDFCDAPSYIDLMKQVARIKMDETGTEAAAVTVVGMLEKSAGQSDEPRYVEFHANRPFLYVISEALTSGAIFFIGQYMGD